MSGTVRKIIDRIKEQRSSGNSVVALTVETRLVLQGFDPERFEYDTPDDPGRLARIQQVADEMRVDIADLLSAADVEPDPEAVPAPPPGGREAAGGEGLSESARAAAAEAGIGLQPATATGASPRPAVPTDHPLQAFKQMAATALAEAEGGDSGARSGASFELLMKSSLLIGLYSFTGNGVFCDQLRYNALFAWFLDVAPGSLELDPESFGEDRKAALDSAAGRAFFDRVVPEAGRRRLFSSDVLQVNGRQIRGWMSAQASA